MVDEVNNNEAPAFLGLDAYDTTAGAEEGRAMEVVGPGGDVLRWPDGRPWTITYYGADSSRLEKLVMRQADREKAMLFRTRQTQSSEVTQKDNIDFLVTATKCWDIPLGDGSPAKSEVKEYRAVYMKYKFIFNQGVAFVGTPANFLPNRAKP